MTANEIKEHNKELHYYLGLIHKGTFNKCLFADACPEKAIQAHSVSRAILSTIQQDGNVIQPEVRTVKDDFERSYPIIKFNSVPITRASTGTFACETHDKKFQMIDTTPMDFDNPKVLDLLFFRAILKEAWILLKNRLGVAELEREKGPIPTHPDLHPDVRLTAILEAVERLRPFIGGVSSLYDKSPASHIVRYIKSGRPFVAASSVGSGVPFPGVKEPNASWAFTVIPQSKNHVVVASWLKGSVIENYFSYLKDINERELAVAISIELIYFCENWFVNPKVWEFYGSDKQQEIKATFDNLIELQLGKYVSRNDGKKEKWYDYIGVSKPHLINLFNYNKSIVAPCPTSWNVLPK